MENCKVLSTQNLALSLSESYVQCCFRKLKLKLGAHEHIVNLYLHDLFEPILIFDPHGQYPWSERKIWPFLSVETGKAMATKLGAHACYINAYLHESFDPILID